MMHRRFARSRQRSGVALALLAGLAGVLRPATARNPNGDPPPFHRRIYEFQHRILPGWTHGSDGAFYKDLRAGRTGRLIEVAREYIGEDYARGISVKAVPGADQALIVFPEPETALHCYFALVIKTGDTYRYVTLERAFQLEGSEAKSVVGEWTKNAHLNHGARVYTDSEQFVKEFAPDGRRDPPPTPAAVTSPRSVAPRPPEDPENEAAHRATLNEKSE